MAHAGQLNDLAEGLIGSITGIGKQDARFAQLKTVAVKGIRDHSHARTNQFDVKAKLDGLVEKFAVLDRDDLSDALQDRLNELPARDKFLPEALSLLMLLSDRPVLHTDSTVLYNTDVQESERKALTWAELNADEPATELSLWDDVARGYHSSGDEAGSDDDSEPTASTSATSIDGSSAVDLARQYVLQPTAEEQAALQALHSLRLIAHAPKNQVATELDVARQSLQMLRGLDTDLYAINHEGKVAIHGGLRTNTTAVSTMKDVLVNFAALGNSLGFLRWWTHVQQLNAWQRTCQAAIGKILSNFDGVLSDLESDYVNPDRTVTVSMIEILHKAQASAVPLCVLSQLVARTISNTVGSYALLDGLYDLACAAQLEGNEEGLAVFSRVLLDTVRTYLRPTATWLRSGIAEDNNESFFVEESKAPCEPATIWHSKYRLRRDAYGHLVAPNFLHNKLAEIFAMGKATMFLKQLSNDALTQISTTRDDADDWDVDPMTSRMRDNPFTPYTQFFDEELGGWISKTGKDCAPRLKCALLHDHGVLGTLTTLSHIYFSADAAHSGSFAEALFESIERRPGTCRDAFLVTELARDTIGNGSSAIHKESLTAVFDRAPNGSASIVAALETLSLHYYFTWPVQNITRERTSATQAQASTLLLQTLYAQRCLRKPFTILRPVSSEAQGPASSSVLKLRQALMAFCDVFHTYITTTGNVLTAEAHAQMLQATGVDDMVAVYATYRARVERALLLGANVMPIRDALVSILTLCERFATLPDGVVDVTRRSEDSDGKTGLKKIADMESEYKASLPFATAGVRSLSRVGGEAMLEMLADRLEWLIS
ncbi:hypothetical protein B0A48_00756 [Cryoendolithus antarcticus]|uniref:Spindle pole body component n=1 Tax=Cryoendolithus antarcticus TaxID=1507870 RepID=A0A1V8TRL2_9PEZI|nr:hypothetical protein B0A48_00756 [Cryoendolithus antarcticus]